MEETEQNKKDIRERLRKVFNSYGKSSRSFSETIGLKPTSFHKVLTGPAGLTVPLANSIELKHGYRAEWLLTGNGNMKVGKHNQLSPLEKCFVDVWESSYQKWYILEILIFENLNKKVADQFWNTLREGVDLEVGDSRRSEAHVNLDRVNQVFRELRNEEKTCLEKNDLQGQKKYSLLNQSLLLATYFGEEWINVRHECEEYQALKTEEDLADFEKILSYINSLLDEVGLK
tara:strand:+ start:2447 stop:3139 length:693 start_codon:yes stop_codon:yes gene_type:complete